MGEDDVGDSDGSGAENTGYNPAPDDWVWQGDLPLLLVAANHRDQVSLSEPSRVIQNAILKPLAFGWAVGRVRFGFDRSRQRAMERRKGAGYRDQTRPREPK